MCQGLRNDSIASKRCWCASIKRPVMIQTPANVTSQSSGPAPCESLTAALEVTKGSASPSEEGIGAPFMFRLSVKPLPLLAAIAFALSSGGCASKPTPVPSNLIVSAKAPRAWPATPIAPPNAPPKIVLVWMSSLTIVSGIWLDGAIVTSTNVASVEVRTAAFSIDSDHVGPGRFRFPYARAGTAPAGPATRARSLDHRSQCGRRSDGRNRRRFRFSNAYS